jgi:uncharacterized protein (DUF736 family)
MENIGELIRNDNGSVTGWIAEPHYDFPHVFLSRNESDNVDAPDFRVVTKSPRGRDVPVGSLWQRAAKETGEVYFGGYIKSGVSGFVPLRLFRSRQQPHVWNVVRKDEQRRQDGARDAAIPDTADTHAGDDGRSFGREPETV